MKLPIPWPWSLPRFLSGAFSFPLFSPHLGRGFSLAEGEREAKTTANEQTACSFYLLGFYCRRSGTRCRGEFILFFFFFFFFLAGWFVNGYVCAQGGQACCPVTALHCCRLQHAQSLAHCSGKLR
jgi:hypothetical protein